MRILVVSHKLIVSGATMTALDLAGELQRRGHEVSVFAEPGTMVDGLAGRGLSYHEAPGERSLTTRWPSWRTASALRRVVRDVHADVVLTYEWVACLDALLGTYLLDGTPLVASVMAMRVPRFMPKRVPLVVGTRVLRDELHRQGFASVALVEPPVDLQGDHPSVDGTAFRHARGIPEQAFVATIVSRLSDIKIESAKIAIAAVERLAERSDVRLTLVGEGPGETELRRCADEVNRRAAREVVVMTGLLEDPRPAYAAADVVLGMGGSALRGLAFGKPLIVVGTDGYSELFTPETSGEFLVQGFWGLGDGDARPDRLAQVLGSLHDDPARMAQLGAFGRQFVCERFGLADIAGSLDAVLQAAAASPPGAQQRRADAAAAMAKLGVVRLQGWVRRRVARRRAS